ncbi:GNAT family N-acetyltransferase [Tepidibacillus sp. LV47]|uniref:GNAT family N-acetyltransferase n=1 Tax=Tepidibacillus sp. LV47 TaxID=3398228 RepID=UPI003AAD0220
MDSIHFRLAELKDLTLICELYHIKPGQKNYKQIFDWIEQQLGIFHVAELNSKIVGGVAIRFPQKNEAWLSHKFIDSTIRNSGIGTKMALYEENYAKKNGAKILRLATRIDNYPVHWMIGEKLKYHQLSRWLRLRKLTPKPLLNSQGKRYFQVLQSPILSWNHDIDDLKKYIEHHIDYFSSDKLVPFEKDLTIYTSLNIEDQSTLKTFKNVTILEENKIKGTALYHIHPSTNEVIIYQIYSNQRAYTYYLIYHLLQFAAKNKLYFSLLAAKPTYPIVPILKEWTKKTNNVRFKPEWLVLGKVLTND